MRKLCCYLVLVCLLVTPAFAGSLNPTLQEVFEKNGVAYSTPPESIALLNQQVREAAAAAVEAGEFKPGTALMWPFKPNKVDPKDPNPYRMPKDDWDKLKFMFDQGLAQYGLDVKADVKGSGSYRGAFDVAAKVDGGYDSDECTAVNGSVLLNHDDAEGTLYTEGDDFFVRRNAKTEVDRIKLPFVEKEVDGSALHGGGFEDNPNPWAMFQNSFQQDNEHWAMAIDLLYEHAKAQPELRPLLGYLFEGGVVPEQYVLTDENLTVVIRRLMLDLANDQRFTKALANTDLFHILMNLGDHASWYDGFDPSRMDEQERQLYWTGVLSMLAVEMDRWGFELPDFELRLDKGRMALTSVWGQRESSGRYDAKLDLSYQPTRDGFVARGLLADGYGNYTVSCNLHDEQLALSLVYVDEHDPTDRTSVLLNATKKDARLSFSVNADDSDALYGDIQLQTNSSGAYKLGGEVRNTDECYSLSGSGNRTVGTFYVDWRKTASPDTEAAQIFHADYSVQPGEVRMRYSYDDSATGHSTPAFVATYDYSALWNDEQFDLSIHNMAGEQGYQANASAKNQSGTWTGNLSVDTTIGGASQQQLNSSFTLNPGNLQASIDFLPNSMPLAITASWDEHTLSAQIGSVFLSSELTLNRNPSDLYARLAWTLLGQQLSIEAGSQGDSSHRRTHFSVSEGTDTLYGANLDTSLDLLSDGWKYSAQLEILPGGEQLSISGEDHYLLDMQRPTPLTLSQKGTIAYRDSAGELSGTYELNHTLTVDERKHKAPAEPHRISTSTSVPVWESEESAEAPTQESTINHEALEDMIANLSPGDLESSPETLNDVPPLPTVKPAPSFK